MGQPVGYDFILRDKPACAARGHAQYQVGKKWVNPDFAKDFPLIS
jgi:hypothetical protein